MSLDGLKIQFGLLLSAAVEAAVSAGRELRQVRGIALYDSRKDLLFTSLEPFGVVEAGLRELELVNERYGVDQSHRIALQLLYEYFARAKGVLVDPDSRHWGYVPRRHIIGKIIVSFGGGRGGALID